MPTQEQLDREMQEADRMRQEMNERINARVTSGMDSVRREVVERPWYGREVTDSIHGQPFTFYGPARAPETEQTTIHGPAQDPATDQGTIYGPGRDVVQGQPVHYGEVLPPEQGPGGSKREE